MNLITTTSTAFENREFLRNTAGNILKNKGTTPEVVEKIVNSTIFESKEIYSNAQLNALKASAQIMLNGGLKETKKYLEKHKRDKKTEETKKYVLGELWNSLDKENSKEESENDLLEFNIDYNLKNIFSAA